MLGMNTSHVDIILLSDFALLCHTLIKPFGIISVGFEHKPSVMERIAEFCRERFLVLDSIISHIR